MDRAVTVNFDDRSPIYRQIADRIEAEVLSGALAGDEQVMSTNKYAAFHRINPATVNRPSSNWWTTAFSTSEGASACS